jgi:hypothetical protein
MANLETLISKGISYVVRGLGASVEWAADNIIHGLGWIVGKILGIFMHSDDASNIATNLTVAIESVSDDIINGAEDRAISEIEKVATEDNIAVALLGEAH